MTKIEGSFVGNGTKAVPYGVFSDVLTLNHDSAINTIYKNEPVLADRLSLFAFGIGQVLGKA